jgi:hypothetical protein
MQKRRFFRRARSARDTVPGSSAQGAKGSEAAGQKVPGFPDSTLEKALLVTPLALILMAYAFEPKDAQIIPDVEETWYGPLNVAYAENDGRAILAFGLPGVQADYLTSLRCVAALRYPGVQVDYPVSYIVLTGPSEHVSGLWEFLAANGTMDSNQAAFDAILAEDLGVFETEFPA